MARTIVLVWLKGKEGQKPDMYEATDVKMVTVAAAKSLAKPDMPWREFKALRIENAGMPTRFINSDDIEDWMFPCEIS